MKKQILTLLAITGFACGALAQGTVYFDNSNGNAGGSAATTGGLFYINVGGVVSALSQDMNYTFLGGTAANSLSVLVTSYGTASTGDSFGGGVIIDNGGNAFPVPSSTPGGTAFLEIQAWTGSGSSYAVGSTTAGNYFGDTGVFTGPLGNNVVSGVPQPGRYLDTMPSLVLNLVAVPEPTTLALAGLGGFGMLMALRRKQV